VDEEDDIIIMHGTLDEIEVVDILCGRGCSDFYHVNLEETWVASACLG